MENDKINENAGFSQPRITLLDLMMVFMIIGVILTLIIPLRQSKTHEQLVKDSLKQMEAIIVAYDHFFHNEGWQPFDLSQLNLRNIDTSVFSFALTDTAIVATTDQIGLSEKAYFFDLRDRRLRVREDSKEYIYDAWLP